MIINSGYFASVPDEFYSYPELATDAEKQAIRETFTECIMLSRRFITFFASSAFFIRYKTGEIEAMKPGYTSADISSLLEKGYEHLFIIAVPGTVQVTLTYLDIKELQSNFDFSTSKIAEGTSEIVPYLPALVDQLSIQNSQNITAMDALRNMSQEEVYYLSKLVDSSVPDRVTEFSNNSCVDLATWKQWYTNFNSFFTYGENNYYTVYMKDMIEKQGWTKLPIGNTFSYITYKNPVGLQVAFYIDNVLRLRIVSKVNFFLPIDNWVAFPFLEISYIEDGNIYVLRIRFENTNPLTNTGYLSKLVGTDRIVEPGVLSVNRITFVRT